MVRWIVAHYKTKKCIKSKKCFHCEFISPSEQFTCLGLNKLPWPYVLFFHEYKK